jgi:hypothetical protein
MGVTKKAKGSKPGAEPARCEKCYRKPPDVILSNRRDLVICTRCLQRERNHAIIKNLEELSNGKVPRKGRPSYGLAPIPFWRISLAGIAQSRDYLTGSWFRVGIPEGTETKPGGLLIIPCPCCAVIDTEAEARPVLLSHAGEWTGRWDNTPNPPAQYWTAYLGQCNACSAILWGVTEPTEARPKANRKTKS